MTALAVSNALLWLVLAVLAVILLALVRQLGILHERLAPIGVLSVGAGLKVGERAPSLDVSDLEGAVRHVAGQRADGKSTLLMFLSPTCPVCKTLLPLVRSSARGEESWLEIWLAGDGEAGAAREFSVAQGLSAFPYLVSAPLAISYQVSRLPYVAVIDGDGILRARAAIEDGDQLSGLLAEARRAVAARNRAGDGRERHQAA
jgi:methylamine dehydrogenase accessory protein MauD